MPRISTCLAMLLASVALAACSTLKPMSSVQSYSGFSCDDIDKEIVNVEYNQKEYEDAGRPNVFLDMLLAVGTGLAAGKMQSTGDYSGAQNVQNNLQDHLNLQDSQRKTGDSLAQRAQLLRELKTAKRCS